MRIYRRDTSQEIWKKSGIFAPSTHGSRFFVWKAFLDLFFALDSLHFVLCKNLIFLCFYATYKIDLKTVFFRKCHLIDVLNDIFEKNTVLRSICILRKNTKILHFCRVQHLRYPMQKINQKKLFKQRNASHGSMEHFGFFWRKNQN